MDLPEWATEKATKRDLFVAMLTAIVMVVLTFGSQLAFAEYQDWQDKPVKVRASAKYQVPTNTTWPLPLAMINQEDHKIVIDDITVRGWTVSQTRKTEKQLNGTKSSVEDLEVYLDEKREELSKRTLNASGDFGDRELFNTIVYTPAQPGNYTGTFEIDVGGESVDVSFKLQAINVSR